MKKFKKLLVALLTTALVISNFLGNIITAKAGMYLDQASAINFVGNVDDIKGVPGETVHIKLPVKAIGAFITEPKITVNTEDMPFTASNIKLTAEGYSADNPPTGISNLNTTNIEFDLKLKETAEIARYKIKVTVESTALNVDTYSRDTYTLDLPTFYLVVDKEKEPAQLTVNSVEFDNAVIGNETELTFVIKNEGEITAYNTYFSVDGYEAVGIVPKYSKLKQLVGDNGTLKSGQSYKVKLPVKIASTATAGTKKLSLKMEYKNIDGVEGSNTNEIYINIDSNSMSPQIEVESTKSASELKAGDEFTYVATIKNIGESNADDIEVLVEGLGTTSFLPKFTTKTISAGSLEANDKVDVKIPLIVSKEATVGLKELPLTITYKDDAGVTVTTTTKLYLEIVGADGVSAEGKPNIVVSNVAQSPNEPNAGARVDVSFDLENKSKINISEIKITITNLTSANFSPIDAEPYQYISKLDGGRKARITIPLKVSDTSPEGMSNLEIKYEYKDSDGALWSDTATLYVLDIQNNGTSSKPKLIISDFSTDLDELRAGSTFKFNFDIYNTHTNVDAKNIKVTVTQADNIFAVTEGSNTFYIKEIPAGETAHNTMELKVKSDATTKAYPLQIKIEYDYDGAEINPETGEMNDVEVTETINLQAVENSRPVVDNIMVGGYDMPTINQPTALTFEFYNMGKSALNNVHASIEGDFYLSTGSMYFIGNVESGYSEFAELEVIPTIEGQAKGTLVVTFEDSNGDEVSVTKEFEATVQGEMTQPFPDGEVPGGMGPVIEPAKAAILPTWLFIIMQIAFLVISIPVSRKVVLSLHRKKLRKQEEAE
ncbi:MAG: hypothetical protein K0S41_2550 [Anaerocolumna sp.]|jgi:hypothetical protein|nr:hypothetical protein [Anaerocolumna sp.]